MRRASFLVSVLLFAFVPIAQGTVTIYDLNENPKYHIDEKGLVYNSHGKLRARIVDNKVYDSFFNAYWFRIDGDNIYDRRDELRYKVVGNRVLDQAGNLKYYIRGKSFRQGTVSLQYNVRRD